MICFSLFLSNAWLGEPSLVFVRVSSWLTCAPVSRFFCWSFSFFLCFSVCLLCCFSSLLFRLFAFLARWGSFGPLGWPDLLCRCVGLFIFKRRHQLVYVCWPAMLCFFGFLERVCSGFGETSLKFIGEVFAFWCFHGSSFPSLFLFVQRAHFSCEVLRFISCVYCYTSLRFAELVLVGRL